MDGVTEKTLRWTDIIKNVWIFRNPHDQSQSVEIPVSSVVLDKNGYADWAEVVRAHGLRQHGQRRNGWGGEQHG